MGSRPSAALEARTIIVAGKGGVGKTTVAILLARRLARRAAAGGGGVLYVALGVGGAAQLPPRAVLGPGVEARAIEGAAALETYLRRRVRPRWLLRRVLSHPLYRRFVAAAPGLKELMALGQVCDEERRRLGGRPRWEAIVVDAPTTGQVLGYLAMPGSAARAFGPGLVAREVRRMLRGLLDPGRSKVLAVTLPEALPLAETEDLLVELRRLGLTPGAVVVNRVRPPGPPSERLARASRATLGAAARRALEVARLEAARAEREARLVASASARFGLTLVTLPEVEVAERTETLGAWEPALIGELEGALDRALAALDAGEGAARRLACAGPEASAATYTSDLVAEGVLGAAARGGALAGALAGALDASLEGGVGRGSGAALAGAEPDAADPLEPWPEGAPAPHAVLPVASAELLGAAALGGARP